MTPDAAWTLLEGDSLDLMLAFPERIDLLVTDPPYAFGGSGGEHELSATVAVVLREAAQRLNPGSWAVIFAASSWRSTSYMVDAVRGVLEPAAARERRALATRSDRSPNLSWTCFDPCPSHEDASEGRMMVCGQTSWEPAGRDAALEPD